jgi:hypothetical protein
MATRREWLTGLALAAGTALTACVINATAQEDVAPVAGAAAAPGQPRADSAANPLAAPPATERRPSDFERTRSGGFTTFRNGFGDGPGGSFGGFGSFSSRSANDEPDEMRQASSEAAAAENAAQNAAQEFSAAKDEVAKAEARSKLRAALQKQFETRQKYRDLEIVQLEAEVKHLRELHQKREAAKSQIIDARLDQLVRSAEGLGWDGSASESRWSGFGGTRSPLRGPPGMGAPGF